MTAQDAPDTAANLDVAADSTPQRTRAVKTSRRLPVQRDWPLWAIVAVQIGILVGAVALWQAAADHGWIDGFFW